MDLWLELSLILLIDLHIIFIDEVSRSFREREVVRIRVLIFTVGYEIAVYGDEQCVEESEHV